MILAAGPALVAGLTLFVQRPLLYLDGDAAKDELTLIDASHFALLVGNHSRFGWSHPGPSWFYLLAAFYGPLGGESWAFVAANLLIIAIAMALIVAVAWRARGPVVALLVGGSLVAYLAVIGEQPFRDPWPPYAVILPMLVFFFLAAAAGAGSTTALVGALVTGSYAVQLHVGTGPTVAAVLVATVAMRLTIDRFGWRRESELAAGISGLRWDRPLVWGGLLVLVVMWIPPAIDELTGHPGNLTLLWAFFTADYPKHPLPLAISILGRLLTPLDWHQLARLEGADISPVSTAFIAIAIAFVGLALGLVAAATTRRDRFAQSIGAVVAVTCITVAFSIRSVSGPVYPYLLLWVTCLPLVLAAGWLGLILERWRGLPKLGVVVVGAVLTALSVAVGLAFQTLPPIPVAAPDTQKAWTLTAAALSGDPKEPVLIEMYSNDTWVVAAGVALQLEKDGRPPRVRESWVFMFGAHARATGSENTVLVFVDLADAATYASQHPGDQLAGQTEAHAVFVNRTR